MSKTIFTALIAAAALTATVADARPNARQRGVASGAEARERATTRDLNAQQLSGAGAVSSAPSAMSTPDAGNPAMSMPDAGTTGAGTATPADTAAPSSPDAMGPMTPSGTTTAPDAAAPPR